jgi:TIR domain
MLMPKRRLPSVFICYRRERDAFSAAVLRAGLAQRWGPSRVFIDVEIPPGIEFPEQLEQRINDADFLLTVIGPSWVNPRLHEQDDWVRREIRIARAHGTAVVPILVEDARMPEPAGLPEDIRYITNKTAYPVSHVTWQADVDELAHELERRIPPLPSAWLSLGEVARLPRRSWIRAVVPEPIVISVGLCAWALFGSKPMLFVVSAIAATTLAVVNLFDRRRRHRVPA